MGRKLFAAAILVLALGVTAQAQTTTTTVTTTTTLATAVPTNDGYFYAATTDLVLSSGSVLVYADTRGGSLTVTLPPATCGCRVGIAKLYDDNLVHVAVADAAHEKAAPPPFLPVTTFDLDSKAAGPVVFVANAASKIWFLGY